MLDDLQWAAKPTLLLFRHVVRAGAGRVLVVGTYRDTELTHDHPVVGVVADLRRQGGVDRISLSGLDDAAVAAFVEQASGQALDEPGLALARAVYAETEGNPFFVREVLRHLVESGAVERRGHGWTTRLPIDELGIPEGVREVVGRRLARLSDGTNHALRIAAVVGPEFDLAVVQAAGDLSEDTLLAAVEEAAAARVVVEVTATCYRFAHALIRATLYESLTAARQVALHRKAGEAIESIHRSALDDHLPALAHHWAKASAPVTDASRAVDYARRAGEQALAQLAHDEAAGYYASALELLDAAGTDPADPRRVELLLGLGESQRRAANPAFRQTLLDAARLARQLGDHQALARAALANTRGNLYSVGLEVDDDRVEALEAAIAAAAPDDRRTRARLLATLGLELAWQPEPTRRLLLSEEALGIARSLDDPETLAHVLLARDYTITAPGNVSERFDATTQVLEAGDRLGDSVVSSRALILRFKAAMERADLAEAERCLERNEALVTDLGQPFLTWAVMHQRAGLRVLRAERDAESAIAAAHEAGAGAGHADLVFFSASQKMALYFDRGRLAELREWIKAVVARIENPGPKVFYAMILAELEGPGAAGAVFDELAATRFAHPTNNVNWLRFSADCAWLTARLGRPEHVSELRSRLQPYADQLVAIALGGAVTGSVAFYLGLLCRTTGDWPAAERYFTAAAATHARINAPTWLARTRLEWARMLLTRCEPGDGERAGHLLHEALATARELELPPVERDAARLLSAA